MGNFPVQDRRQTAQMIAAVQNTIADCSMIMLTCFLEPDSYIFAVHIEHITFSFKW